MCLKNSVEDIHNVEIDYDIISFVKELKFFYKSQNLNVRSKFSLLFFSFLHFILHDKN